jgi:outer membrane receptor protein involved in Fe transport
VLINGKRRHRSAYIDVTAQGAQAVDLAEIPLSAIDRIELLRDGASAQYGSDAIAGVINIILKDRPGFEGYTQVGQYYAGDGANYLIGANQGIALGDRGSLSVSLEGYIGEATSRSRQRPNAAALIAAATRPSSSRWCSGSDSLTPRACSRSSTPGITSTTPPRLSLRRRVPQLRQRMARRRRPLGSSCGGKLTERVQQLIASRNGRDNP